MPQRPASSARSRASIALWPAEGWTVANPRSRPGCRRTHCAYHPFCRSQVSWRSQYQPSMTHAAIPASSMSAMSVSGSAQPWIGRVPGGATHADHAGSPRAAPHAAGLSATSGGYTWTGASITPSAGMGVASPIARLGRQPPAPGDGYLSGPKEGDRADPVDHPRDPQVWQPGRRQPLPHRLGGQRKGRPHPEPPPPRRVGKPDDNGHRSLGLVDSEDLRDLLLDGPVRHHLAAHLGEAREPSLDGHEPVPVDACEVPRDEPSVPQVRLRALAQVMREHVLPAQQEDARLAGADLLPRLGGDDARRHSGQEAPDGAGLLAYLRVGGPRGHGRMRLVDVRDRRRLGQAVALEDLQVKHLQEAPAQLLGKLLP